MNKLPFLLLAMLCMQLAWADNTSKNAESKIEKVTVFPDGAQVTRTGRANVSAGKTDIIFQGLSPYLDKSSISVGIKGNATVISVTEQINHLNEQKKKDEVRVLEKREDELAKRVDEQQVMKDVYDEEVEMLVKNQLVNSQHTDLKTPDLKAALDFHEERLTQLKKNLLVYTRIIQKLNDTIAVINLQLKELNSKQDPSTTDLVVTLSAKQATEADLTISYFVNYAGWYPTYDVRVDDISKPMNLSYRANVHQNTGEEWKEVKMTLSNGAPKLSGVHPELQTWYLSNGSVYQKSIPYNYQYGNRKPDPNVTNVHGKVYDDKGQPVAFASILVKGTTVGTTSDDKGNYSLQLPGGPNYIVVTFIGYERSEIPVFSDLINIKMTQSANRLDEVMVMANGSYEQGLVSEGYNDKSVAKVKAPAVYNVQTTENLSPTTFSYDIEVPYTIPNDGKTYTVDIKQQEIPADYLYVTVPRLDKTAFLTARIAGWDDYNLLSGEANLYYEGTYLGKTLLNATADNDTLELSLGRDNSVTVTRTKLKDFSKKTFFGDKKVDSRAFEIGIRNTKGQPVHILVQDQFPVSTQKEIEVDQQEFIGAKLDEGTGILSWTLDVPPSTEKKVSFKYTVKYPKDYRIQLE